MKLGTMSGFGGQPQTMPRNADVSLEQEAMILADEIMLDLKESGSGCMTIVSSDSGERYELCAKYLRGVSYQKKLVEFLDPLTSAESQEFHHIFTRT